MLSDKALRAASDAMIVNGPSGKFIDTDPARIVRAYLRALPGDEATVERVAEALFHLESGEDTNWADEPGWSATVYRKHARAVLAALAESGAGPE